MNGGSLVAILALVATFATGPSSGADPSPPPNLELTSDKNLVSPGADITMVCTVYNNPAGSFLRWEKIVPADDDSEAKYTIANNGLLEPDFEELRPFEGQAPDLRYVVSMKVGDSPSDLIATLKIVGAVPEDTGTIRCSLPMVEGGAMYKEERLDVQVEPATIELQVKNNTELVEFEEDGKVMFMENDIVEVKCIVTGGYPAPEVIVSIGDENLTSQFTREDEKKEEETDTAGMIKYSYDVTVELEELTISYAHAGKKLSCAAKVPNGEEYSVSSGFLIKMSGVRPLFVCSHELIGFYYQKDVNITCVVKANPPVNSAYIYYHEFGADERTVMQVDGPGYENFQATLTPEGDGSLMTLNIDLAYPNFFRDYYFVVKNNVGEVEHKITLVNDPDQEIFNSSVGMMITLPVLLLCLVAALSWQHL